MHVFENITASGCFILFELKSRLADSKHELQKWQILFSEEHYLWGLLL